MKSERKKGGIMSILSQIEKPSARPVIVTICGDSGLGKTNLAATFPKPIFIRAEDGLQGIPAEICPDAETFFTKRIK